MKTEKNLVGFDRVLAAAMMVALGGGLASMAAVLPAGYTPVEYIESSGTQYIDTGYVPKADTAVECVANLGTTYPANYAAVYGARNANYQSGANVFFCRFNGANKATYNRTGTENQTSYGTALMYGEKISLASYRDGSSWANAAGKWGYNGVYGKTGDSVNNMFIFNLNTGTGADSLKADGSWCCMKLYSFRILEGGQLKRDFVPCVHEDVAGLYDTVSGTFFANAGTGTFTAGTAVADTVVYDAVWNGGADFTSSSAWTCRTFAGAAVANGVPGAGTRYVTLAADADWSGFDFATYAGSGVIDLQGHRLRVSVKGIPANDLNFTDTVGGGVVTFVVPEGETATSAMWRYSGLVQVVKEGPGTFIHAAPTCAFTGGLQVNGGVFRNAGVQGYTFPLGNLNSTIQANAGGAFDFNGTVNWPYTRFVLNGGTFTNSGTQTPTGNCNITTLDVLADSTITGNGLSVIGWGYIPTAINLNGHKLTVNQVPSSYFYILNSTITGGELEVLSGTCKTEKSFTVAGPLTLTIDEAAGAVWASDAWSTNRDDPQTVTVNAEGGALLVGNTDVNAPARIDLAVTGPVLCTNYTWLTSAPDANVTFAAHAMPVLGYADALANPITLTTHSLRVTDPTTGNATITVGAGETLRFDTLDLVDGAYTDATGKPVRTFTNNVVLDGGTLLLTGANEIVLAGNVSGTGIIRKEGNGTASITGAVTVDSSSQIQVTAGILRLASAGEAAIAVTGGKIANLVNGTLDLSANTASVSGGNFQIDGGTIIIGDGFSGWCSTFGTGTMRLTGTAALVGNPGIAVRETTTLELAKEGVVSLGSVISIDYGATLKIATESVPFNAITFNGGTLDLNGHDLTLGSWTSSSPWSTIVNNGATPATLTLDHAGAQSLSGAFLNGTGGLSVVKQGAGTLTFAGKANCTAFNVAAGTVVSRPPNTVKGVALRFTPHTSKATGVYLNSGVQLGELALKRAGVWLPWPSGTSAATAVNYGLGASGGQNAAQLINRTVSGSGDKLYDTLYCDPVTITFGAEMEFDSYDLATGGDADGRDPGAWTMEIGCKEGSATVWYPCGAKTDYSATASRNAWMGGFAVSDYRPRFTGTAVTVAEGAVLEMQDSQETIAELTLAGELVRSSEAPYTEAPSIAAGGKLRTRAGLKAKSFRFIVSKTETGTTAMQISEFQIYHGGKRVPWPSGTSVAWTGGNSSAAEAPAKIIDGNPGTKCFTGGNVGTFTITSPEPLIFDAYCWYTANDDHNRDPVSWQFDASDDGVNWYRFDAVADRACPAARQSLAYMSGPLVGDYVFAKYLQFEITNVRSGANAMQFSEFEVLKDGAKVAWPANTRMGWSLYRNNNTKELPTNLIDGNWGTKFFTSESGLGIVRIFCPGGVKFDSYRWVTGNDSASTRDPIGWKFRASMDGVHWFELDNVPNYNTTASRNVVAYTSPMLAQRFEVLNDDAAIALDDTTLAVEGTETLGGVGGTGTLEVVGTSTLKVAANTTQSFEGTVSGSGTLVKDGEGVQVLKGAMTLAGQLVVKAGDLRLDGVVLPNGLTIVLEGGVLTGTATCAGNVTVQSKGGAYGAAIALEGALTLDGAMKLEPDAKVLTNRVCFEYGSTDANSEAAFLASTCSVELAARYHFKTKIEGNKMKLVIYPECTVIYVR